GVHAEAPIASECVRRIYRQFLIDKPAERHSTFVIQRDDRSWTAKHEGGVLVSSPQLETVIMTLEAAICTRVLEHRSDWVAVHGATLIDSDGALFITGPSGAGKSTLSLALTGRGWRVLSDDVAF